jgi:hypothetical protein
MGPCPGLERKRESAISEDVAEALDRRFDHMPEILRHGQIDFRQRHPELPACALPSDEAALDHVGQGRDHEQGIAFRVLVDQFGEACG